MSALLDPLLALLVLGLLLFVALALLSPLEALGWWAGWSRRQVDQVADAAVLAEAKPIAPDAHFIVYLTAIGGISAEDISRRERGFLEKLAERVPEAVIVDDVFPFSVTNNPLNGERPLSWLWQRIHNSRMRGRGALLSSLIFARNLLQVAVSSDPRYGPIYNVGVAREIVRSLVRQGYSPQHHRPVTVIGWSGGGQIALGVARYLHEALKAAVYVVSVGGVLSDDKSIASVAHLYHLQGSRDKFPQVGAFLYPGRWPFVRYSAWNEALRAGKITVIDPGPMRHTGREDYFDHKRTVEDGKTYVERTTEIIADIVLATD